jgi:hypothetical protein
LLYRSSPQSNGQSADNYKRSTYQDGWRWNSAEKNKVSDLENYEQRLDVHPRNGRELYGGQIEGGTVRTNSSKTPFDRRDSWDDELSENCEVSLRWRTGVSAPHEPFDACW